MARTGSSPSLAQWLLRYGGRLPIPKLQGIYARIPAFRDEQHREFVVDFEGLRYKGTLAQYVDRKIFYFGSYSPDELAFLAKAGRIIRGRHQVSTFVDVGANVGQHSLFMSRHVDRVLAFEPNAEVADRLQANIEFNSISNISLVRTALGSEQAEGRLGSGLENNSGSRSLTWSLDPSLDTIVSIVRADDVLEAYGVQRIDILKLDVEGYEKHVLMGARACLRRDKPVILFELVGRDVKGGFASEAELRDSLYEGATLFSLGPRGDLLPFEWQNEEAVCIPEDLVPDFKSMA